MSFLEIMISIFLSIFFVLVFEIEGQRTNTKANQEPSKMRPFSRGGRAPPMYNCHVKSKQIAMDPHNATHHKHQLGIPPTPPTKDNPQTIKYTTTEPNNWSGLLFPTLSDFHINSPPKQVLVMA